MSGRNLFQKVAPLISLIVFLLRLLPFSVRHFLWHWANSTPGLLGVGWRYCLLKSLAKVCGDNVRVGVNVEINGFRNLEIGSNVSIHRECYIEAEGGVRIGSEVSIAHQSSILSSNHGWSNESLPIKYNPIQPAPVVIHDDVWIGCAVRVLSGVTIESRSILAAGAIITKSVAGRTIVGGNPARVLKTF